MLTTLFSAPSFGVLNVNNTLGALFVGEVITATLYGISILQFYTYYRKNASDHALMKVLVFVLLLLDTTHFVGYTEAAWFYGVTNYLNPLVILDTVHWSIQFAYVSAILSEILVDGIYSYQIYRSSGASAWITAVAVQTFTTGMAASAFGILLVIRIAKFSLPELNARVGWILYVELALQTAKNIEMAVLLSFILWKMRTGIRRTDSLLHTLTMFTVNTMTLTSIVSIACIAAVAASPGTLIFMPILTMHPKTMINSLLAFLNSRTVFRTMNDEPISVHLSGMRFAAAPRADTNISTPPVVLQASTGEQDMEKR